MDSKDNRTQQQQQKDSKIDPEKATGLDTNGNQSASGSEPDVTKQGAPTDVESEEEKKDEKPAPVNPWMDPSSFPDGGLKAWLTVAGGAACLFCSFGWINCIGIFQDYYLQNQLRDYTPSEVAWIPSLQVFFMLVGGPFTGKIFDDYGPRPLLVAGTFLHVFGLMMVSISDKYYQIMLSQAICSAIGASMIFTPAFTSAATWFFKRRGMALGLVTAGSSLGGVIFPFMVIKLIPQVGFGWTFRICAFLILGLLIFANLTVRSRIAPTKRPFQLMNFVRPYGEPLFAVLGAAVFFFLWGMFIPFTFLVVVAQSHGMSYQLANYLVPILNAASIFGRTIPNIVADKVGAFNVMIVMSSITTILILGLWLPATGNAAQIVFAVLFGISSGAGISLNPVLAAKISPIKDIGIRTGALFGLGSLAALTGSPISGQIVTDTADFRYSIAFSGVSTAVGVALYFTARVMQQGLKPVKV